MAGVPSYHSLRPHRWRRTLVATFLLGTVTLLLAGGFSSAASATEPPVRFASAVAVGRAADSIDSSAHLTALTDVRMGQTALAGPRTKGEGGESGPDGQVRKVAALAGYLAYGLMAMTLTWGLLTTTGFARRWVDRRTMQGGHMLLAVLFLTFGWVHGLTYVFQTQEKFSVAKALIPFIQGGEPEVAMGIVGLELSLAIAVSIWIQRRLTYRRWRIVHWLAYPAFALSLAHTVATSKEAQSLGLIGIAVIGSALVVIALFVLRVMPGAPITRARIAPVEP